MVKDMAPLSAPPDGQTDFATIFADIDFKTYMQKMQTQMLVDSFGNVVRFLITRFIVNCSE